MTLRLFNTLTKTKDEFAPLDPKNVRMYVCGPTVYDFAHIGNARPVIVFDVLFRLLRHTYGDAHVTYVRNITDVDDKINARAAERGISIRALTEETARIYDEDVAALGNLPPTVTPRATEHIAQMIRIIEQLIAAGHAYAADGHVLFDVSSKADYGKLSRRSLDEMIAGARVEVAPYKKNAMDFVLWKPSSDLEGGAALPGWDSPWGRGRPGWHIECSAMAGEYLGETFDIHGGGIDLQFPHHENEIAQSEGAHHGHPLAKVWMHNGFLQVEGEKMSKSLGNFVTIRELLTEWKNNGWSGDAIRFCMMRTHYRQPIDWTFKGLEEAHLTLRSLCEGLEDCRPTSIPSEVMDALKDDLNVPLAISRLHALKKDKRNSELLASFHLLGLSGDPLKVVRNTIIHLKGVEAKASVGNVSVRVVPNPDEIEKHISLRNTARKNKDFKESDRIRDDLLAKGIVLKDGPQGTTWEVKR
ncbi:MAG TPA: cysteine--tRNA ligase [Rhizomicrobium sp.]|nr:cysteine--tRNA ligase [Rhizomicrobium sp.]